MSRPWGTQLIRVDNGRWQVIIDRDQDRVQVTNKVRNRAFECSVGESDQLARVIDAANSVPDDSEAILHEPGPAFRRPDEERPDPETGGAAGSAETRAPADAAAADGQAAAR